MIGPLLRRGGLALGIIALHRALGSWLVGIDPIAELISGNRWGVGAVLVCIIALRGLVWFVLVPWVGIGVVRGWWATRPRTFETRGGPPPVLPEDLQSLRDDPSMPADR